MSCSHPYYVMDVYVPREWEGKKINQICLDMEKIRLKLKEAVNYTWDNSHFYITDIYGKLSITLLFSPDYGINAWSYNTGAKIITQWNYNRKWTKKDTKELQDIVHHLEEGETQCQVCKNWFKTGDWKHYSFAGAVCNKDFDPRIHLPPDTSGS